MVGVKDNVMNQDFGASDKYPALVLSAAISVSVALCRMPAEPPCPWGLCSVSPISYQSCYRTKVCIIVSHKGLCVSSVPKMYLNSATEA